MARLIDLGAHGLLGKILRLPLKLIPGRARVSVLGGINRGCRWRVGSSIHGCWLGFYEAEKQQRIRALVRPGMVAWDIGANAGFYTLALSRLTGSEGQVFAFEPLAENAAYLLDHLRLNRCDNTELYQLAVSDRNGIAPFHVSASNAMGQLSDAGKYRVPTAAVDGLIWSDGLPVPDIVKMDVEGAEGRVLHGAGRLLSMRKTIWLVALHGPDQCREVSRILSGHGYEIYRLDGSRILGEDVDTDEIYALPG